MALTDTQVKQAKPKNKPYTLKDIQGLSLYIPASGSKRWHFRFTFAGKEGRISFGVYPQISLQEARIKCEEARMQIKEGIKPHNQETVAGMPIVNNGPVFKDFVHKWVEFKLKKLGSKPSKEKKNSGRQGTAVQIERYLRLDILPVLGHLCMNTIKRTDVLTVQARIEKRGALSISEKVRTWLNEIFRYAVATGVIDINPAADMDMAALPYRRIRHNPHLQMHELPELMVKLHNYKGDRQTELGLRLLLLTGVRTGELRFAEPFQFDLDNAIWRIPPEDVKQLQRVKQEKDNKIPDYIVPLPTQAINIIKELLSYKFPSQRYLFCHRTRPHQAISENTLNAALKREGFKNRLTGHGIRATISTALNELGYNKDWIEAQLSHSDKDHIRAAYNHAQYVEQRRAMMQEWADKLDQWEIDGLQNMLPSSQ